MNEVTMYMLLVSIVLGIFWYGIQAKRKQAKSRRNKPKSIELTKKERVRVDLLVQELLQSGTGIQEAIGVAENQILRER